MNYLVKAPTGCNGQTQWVPCQTIQEAQAIAAISARFDRQAVIYDMHTRKPI